MPSIIETATRKIGEHAETHGQPIWQVVIRLDNNDVFERDFIQWTQPAPLHIEEEFRRFPSTFRRLDVDNQ